MYRECCSIIVTHVCLWIYSYIVALQMDVCNDSLARLTASSKPHAISNNKMVCDFMKIGLRKGAICVLLTEIRSQDSLKKHFTRYLLKEPSQNSSTGGVSKARGTLQHLFKS